MARLATTSDAFNAVAEPQRRQILDLLAQGERSVNEIAALLELNAPERRPLMRKFVSGIFVRFERTTGDAHLASLNGYLKATQLEFVERLR